MSSKVISSFGSIAITWIKLPDRCLIWRIFISNHILFRYETKWKDLTSLIVSSRNVWKSKSRPRIFHLWTLVSSIIPEMAGQLQCTDEFYQKRSKWSLKKSHCILCLVWTRHAWWNGFLPCLHKRSHRFIHSEDFLISIPYVLFRTFT